MGWLPPAQAAQGPTVASVTSRDGTHTALGSAGPTPHLVLLGQLKRQKVFDIPSSLLPCEVLSKVHCKVQHELPRLTRGYTDPKGKQGFQPTKQSITFAAAQWAQTQCGRRTILRSAEKELLRSGHVRNAQGWWPCCWLGQGQGNGASSRAGDSEEHEKH